MKIIPIHINNNPTHLKLQAHYDDNNKFDNLTNSTGSQIPHQNHGTTILAQINHTEYEIPKYITKYTTIIEALATPDIMK